MPVLLEVFPRERPDYHEQRQVHLLRCLARAQELRHPGLVRIIELGRRTEYDFVVRELVDGGSMRELVEKGGRVPLGRALAAAEDVLLALCAAHEAALCHGAITPEVMLLDYDGRVRLDNFGRPLDVQDLTEFTPTPGGRLTGPSLYLAPEQVGDPGSGDIRSDLYALGSCLYEMLSGRAPFDPVPPEHVAERRLAGAPVPLGDLDPSLPPGVCSFVGELMAEDPAARPAEPQLALDRLRALATALSRRADTRGKVQVKMPQSKGLPGELPALFWTAVAALLLGAAVVPLYMLWAGRRGGGAPVNAPAAEAPTEHVAGGPLVVLQPAVRLGAEPLPRGTRLSVLALSGVVLSQAEWLGPTDPFRAAEMIASGHDVSEVLTERKPRYVLRLTHAPGLNRLNSTRHTASRWTCARGRLWGRPGRPNERGASPRRWRPWARRRSSRAGRRSSRCSTPCARGRRRGGARGA